MKTEVSFCSKLIDAGTLSKSSFLFGSLFNAFQAGCIEFTSPASLDPALHVAAFLLGTPLDVDVELPEHLSRLILLEAVSPIVCLDVLEVTDDVH